MTTMPQPLKKRCVVRTIAMEDTLSTLGGDLCTHLLKNYLDTKALCSLGATNQAWFVECSADYLWFSICSKLWDTKAYVPLRFRKAPSRDSFIQATIDSKRKTLCDEDFSELIFAFRFKLQAGQYWTSLDPSWELQTSISLIEDLDDRIENMDEDEIMCLSAEYVDPLRTTDKYFPPIVSTDSLVDQSDHRFPGPMLVKFTISNGQRSIVNASQSQQTELERQIKQDYPDISWRFTKSRTEDGKRVRGQFIQVNRWPSLKIRRLADWGWQLVGSCTHF